MINFIKKLFRINTMNITNVAITETQITLTLVDGTTQIFVLQTVPATPEIITVPLNTPIEIVAR